MASPLDNVVDGYEIVTELGFQNVFDIDTDDMFYDLPQEMKYSTEKSPFHQSDSGVSEMSEIGYSNPKSVESSCSEPKSPAMLDSLVESLDFSPFGSNDRELEEYMCGSDKPSTGADSDLLEYIARKSQQQSIATEYVKQSKEEILSGECGNKDYDISSEMESRQEILSDESENEQSRHAVGKENRMCTRRSTNASRNKTKFPSVVLKSPTNKRSEEAGENPITVIEDCSPAGPKKVKIIKVVKTTGGSCSNETIAQVTTAIDCRNRKNAMNAKMNREKKKAYVQKLETSLEEIENKNRTLASENEKLIADKKALEEQLDYFKNVLANQSTLSKVLNTMENIKGVKLSSSMSISSRKRGLRSDHTYDGKRRKVGNSEHTSIPEFPSSSAGICLHVDDDTVSLEFCPHCSKMAKSAER